MYSIFPLQQVILGIVLILVPTHNMSKVKFDRNTRHEFLKLVDYIGVEKI
jgi:hypothetical protein